MLNRVRCRAWCVAARWYPSLLRFLVGAVITASSSGFAQKAGVTGGYVPQVQYATTAALSLFVDPTGNDNGPCLASGTSACATPAGAIARIPYRVRNAVTVSMAAGTYTNLRVQNLMFEFGGTLTFNGPDNNFTPATGTATGSLTAVSNTTNAPPTVTDSTQSWTVNDLRGRYLEMTNGTANNVRRVIVSNTATTLTLASSYNTAPSVGNTYAIRTPGVILSGTSGLVVKNIGVGGGAALGGISTTSITLSRIESNSTSNPCALANNTVLVALDRVRCIVTANGSNAFTAQSNPMGMTLSNVYAEATNVSAMSLSRGFYSFTNSSYARTGASTTSNPTLAVVGGANVSGIGLTLENTSSAGVTLGFDVGTNFDLNVATSTAILRSICTAGGTARGIYVPPAAVGVASGGANLSIGNYLASDCDTAAVEIHGHSVGGTFINPVITNGGTGFSVNRGAFVNFGGTTPSFTGLGGGELQVDGVDFTFASLSTGITNLATTSNFSP